MRRTARIIYLSVLAVLLVVIATSLLYAGTRISHIVLAGIGLISIVTSLVPYFSSIYLFKKYEMDPSNQSNKIFAIVLYLCCYPIKIWVIFATIYEILFGNNHWAFG
jgi:hypothetical protein